MHWVEIATVVVHNPESTLMLLRSKKEIYPLSTFAFTVTQSDQYRLQKNIGALILYRDGRIKEISAIKKDGFYGDNFYEKIKSALFGFYKINTTLKDVDMPFSELSGLIANLILIDSRKEDPGFNLMNIDDLAEKIKTAKDADQIFSLISVPKPEDCLDIL